MKSAISGANRAVRLQTLRHEGGCGARRALPRFCCGLLPGCAALRSFRSGRSAFSAAGATSAPRRSRGRPRRTPTRAGTTSRGAGAACAVGMALAYPAPVALPAPAARADDAVRGRREPEEDGDQHGADEPAAGRDRRRRRSARSRGRRAPCRGRDAARRLVAGLVPAQAAAHAVSLEVKAYYEARAREYDDWWLGRGCMRRRDARAGSRRWRCCSGRSRRCRRRARSTSPAARAS